MTTESVIFDSADFATGGARAIADRVSAAIEARGTCSLALSGGHTPAPVYRALAAEPFLSAVDWDRVVFLFGDERCVPPDDEQSNYRMARESWFEPAGIAPAQVRRIRGEDEPHLAALQYQQELAELFRTSGRPPIDVTILGLGDNGHTASLFPGTAALRSRRNVVAQYVEVMRSWRITLTAAALNRSRSVLFLVEGGSKAEMVRNIRNGPYQPEVWPAQLIEPEGGAVWLLDAPAAALQESS